MVGVERRPSDWRILLAGNNAKNGTGDPRGIHGTYGQASQDSGIPRQMSKEVHGNGG